MIVVRALIEEASPPEGVLAAKYREMLPPTPPGPTISEDEMVAWVAALPAAFMSAVVPIAALAAQAIVDLAAASSTSPESVLTDLASRVL